MAHTSANAGQVGPARGASLDRALRKLFPSTSKLTFNPLFRAAVNSFDVVPRLMFPEFRTLPPNHLRIRIGVGNRILNNQTHFLVHARDFWMFVFSEGIATMHSDILDIGVGCGRWAHWLRDYNFRGRQFTGTYVGVDIDEEAIAWCQKHYDSERFRFFVSTDTSVSHHHMAASQSVYRIPLADNSFDLVFSNSLLTHLLEAELENYLRESYRLLCAGGAMMHSHFNPFAPGRVAGSLAGLFVGPVQVAGSFTVFGPKSAAVKVSAGSYRQLFCLEAPESWFEDFGEAQLVSGKAEVKFDPQFASVVKRDHYHVFLSPNGDCNGLYVSGRSPRGFTVREFQKGSSNLRFSYRVAARRKDVPDERMPEVALPPMATVQGRGPRSASVKKASKK